jgi:hypothetical protein
MRHVNLVIANKDVGIHGTHACEHANHNDGGREGGGREGGREGGRKGQRDISISTNSGSPIRYCIIYGLSV